MKVKLYKSTVEFNKIIAHKTQLMRIKHPENGLFEFEPGQFVTISVAHNIKRSYSVACMPNLPYLDLIADTVAGGPGSQFFENTKEGDTIEFLFPLGRFVYQENDLPAYFFATKTGATPFMSMIEYALKILKTNRQIYLYLGFRNLKDVFGDDLFSDLAKKYSNFHYYLTLSQPKEDWKGYKGRITQFIEKIEDNDLHAFLCGGSDMIGQVKNDLIAKNIKEENIHFEKFY